MGHQQDLALLPIAADGDARDDLAAALVCLDLQRGLSRYPAIDVCHDLADLLDRRIGPAHLRLDSFNLPSHCDAVLDPGRLLGPDPHQATRRTGQAGAVPFHFRIDLNIQPIQATGLRGDCRALLLHNRVHLADCSSLTGDRSSARPSDKRRRSIALPNALLDHHRVDSHDDTGDCCLVRVQSQRCAGTVSYRDRVGIASPGSRIRDVGRRPPRAIV
ncbi:hypothetical protein D3C81_1450910 [compost metagenome]